MDCGPGTRTQTNPFSSVVSSRVCCHGNRKWTKMPALPKLKVEGTKAKEEAEPCCSRVSPVSTMNWHAGVGHLLLWPWQYASLCSWMIRQHSRVPRHKALPRHLTLFLCRAGHHCVRMWNRLEMGHSECYCLLVTESSGWAMWPSLKMNRTQHISVFKVQSL